MWSELNKNETWRLEDCDEMEESSGKALGEMLKSIAGMSSLQTGNSISKPVIHGLHSNRIIIMNTTTTQSNS